MVNTYERLLNQYNRFEECLLLDYWSENLCRDFVVLISNIWDAPGRKRVNLDVHAPVYLRFQQCQRVLVVNAFSDDILRHPDLVNWGLNEFSLIAVEDLSSGWFRFKILWEHDRKIEIDCRALHIEEGVLTTEIQTKYPW
jgi:hypothetical protein